MIALQQLLPSIFLGGEIPAKDIVACYAVRAPRSAVSAEVATAGIASGGYKSRFISHRNFL